MSGGFPSLPSSNRRYPFLIGTLYLTSLPTLISLTPVSLHMVPLIVPLTLLKHHVNRSPVPEWVLAPSTAWVHQQVYLHPYPKELMLRNHV